MDQVIAVELVGALAVFAALVALGVWGLPKLRKQEQGYPLEAEIEAALLPVVFDGICAAYRVSELAVDEAHKRLDGLDKKAIADSVYAMLPEQVGGYDVSVIKALVPPERFAQLVQNAYDQFDRFYVEKRAHFDRLFEQWKSENRIP